jgi:ATP-binding cassette, subfamily B, bacterial
MTNDTPQAAALAPKAAPRNFSSLGMIWGFARRYPLQIVAALCALLCSSLATISISIALRGVIDSGFGGKAMDASAAGLPQAAALAPVHMAGAGAMTTWFYLLFCVVLLLALSTAVRFYFVSWLGERVVADIRLGVQRNLLRLSPAYFELNRPAEIASRLTTDTTQIEQLVGTTISMALRNFLTAVLGVSYLVYLAPKLAVGLLIGIPLVVIPIIIMSRTLRKLSRYSQDKIADVGTIIDEELGAMKIVQAFGQESREAERYRGAVENSFKAAKRRITLRAGMTTVMITLVFSALIGLLWQGARDVQNGSMTGGSIVAFVFVGGLIAGALGAFSEVFADISRASGAASRLGELLRQVPDIAPPAVPHALPAPVQGAVRFENIRFHYPTRPEVSALNGFSLNIAAGEMVAVVGPSGAGKSTLFQLLERFYDPEEGEILLENVALPELDPAVLRAHLALVPQETVIFAASVRDNLRYGKPDADDDALWAAADTANASEFIKQLPAGLDTLLGENGAGLSGGQRQRIAIARAVLKDAPVLLLDEATSALDAESEQLVQQALERLMKGRTTLVIAHRLATIRSAKRIIVMDEGRIVEQGTHASLLEAGGLYARLAKLQFNEG